MIKLLKTLIIGLILLVGSQAFGADQNIYLDNAGAGDGSIGNPYGAWAEINWTTGEANSIFDWVAAGDDVHINFKSGVTWDGAEVAIGTSGAIGHPITLQAYDAGARPIITTRSAVVGWTTGGNWTDQSGNIWTITLVDDIYRAWFDGTEFLQSETAGGVDITSRWHYTGTTLSVYATENPSTFYASMESARLMGGTGWTVVVSGKTYIDFEGLDIRGGYSSVYLRNCSYINFNDMAIGMDAGSIGIESWNNNDQTSDYINIYDSTFATGYDFVYDFEKPGPSDGISVRDGSSNWNVQRNTFTNWGHCALLVIQMIDDVDITDFDFSYNDVSGPNVSYMRGFDVEGIANSIASVYIHHNDFHDMTVRNQISGQNTHVYANLFRDVTESPAIAQQVGQGLSIESYGSLVVTGNKIYNNTFYNIASVGLRVSTNSTHVAISGNEVKNNIFSQCGQDSASWPDLALWHELDNAISSNTYSNNDWHESGQATIMRYRGNDYTVTNFEGAISQSDVAADNIQLAPLFKNAAGGDFTLTSSSPCRNAGTYLVGYEAKLDPTSTWPDDVRTRDDILSIGAYAVNRGAAGM